MESKGILIIFEPIKEGCFSSFIGGFIFVVLIIGGFFSSVEWIPTLLASYFSSANILPLLLLFALLLEIGAIMQFYAIKWIEAVIIISFFLSVLLLVTNRLLGIYNGLVGQQIPFPNDIIVWIGYIMSCIEIAFIFSSLFIGLPFLILRKIRKQNSICLQTWQPARKNKRLHPFLAFLIIVASVTLVIKISCVYYNNSDYYSTTEETTKTNQFVNTSVFENQTYSNSVVGYVINVDTRLQTFESESRSSEAKFFVNRGECVQILTYDAASGWCCIEYDGQNAYTEIKYIVTKRNVKKGVVVNVNKSLKIYKFPDAQSDSVGSVPQGSSVEILDEDISNNWMIILYDGIVGYVKNDYIEK